MPHLESKNPLLPAFLGTRRRAVFYVALTLGPVLFVLKIPQIRGQDYPSSSVPRQFLAKKKEIDETIIEPCKSERIQEAAKIRQSIDECPCTSAEKQEKTTELDATLQIEMRRCEKKGTDALDEYKRVLVAQAQNDFIEFKAKVELDRQILRNLGFNRAVSEMESWAEYGEKAQSEYTRRAQNELIAKFFQSIHLKAEAMAATSQITSEKALSLFNLFKATGVKHEALFDDLAAAGRGDRQIPERMLWEKITLRTEQMNEARELVETEDQAADIFNSMLDVAGWMAPELVPYLSIVKDATWIGYATYTHAEVMQGMHEVDRLTTLTEAQLKDLEPVTRRLKKDVTGLVEAKKVLEWAKAAGDDSTSLVRKPNDR